MSEATLQSAREELSQALEPFEQRLREILPQQTILHADETQVPINKVEHWLHCVCTPLLTFFAIQLDRGKEAIEAIGIIARFTGWLMTDFLASYMGLDNCVHTFCKSHLMRELVFLFEQHQQAWAKDLYDLFLEMLKCIKDRKSCDAPMSRKEFKQWRRRYRNILRLADKPTPSRWHNWPASAPSNPKNRIYWIGSNVTRTAFSPSCGNGTSAHSVTFSPLTPTPLTAARSTIAS